MTHLRVESPYSPDLDVEVAPGARLIDVCDEHEAGIPFSCRSASCGTCRVDVLQGASELDEPGDEERELLEVLGDDPRRCRLACQARIVGDGPIRLRPSTDW
jgi:2Fe-2S ferredoxin